MDLFTEIKPLFDKIEPVQSTQSFFAESFTNIRIAGFLVWFIIIVIMIAWSRVSYVIMHHSLIS